MPGTSNIIYVARDIERALGMEPGEHAGTGGNYFIITNTSAYAGEIQKKYPKYIFLVERNAGTEPLDTRELLAHPDTDKIIASIASDASGIFLLVSLLVFKNTARIEAFCKEKNWKLLNPPAALAEQIENKISQVAWLGDVARYLPPHHIVTTSEIAAIHSAKNFTLQRPFIIQWAHGHTGGGTILVPSGPAGDKILAALAEKFPDREARVTEYIKGPMFTANICVSADRNAENPAGVAIGNISYQITGTLPFTDNPFATVGNDWSLPHSVLGEEMLAKFHEIARAVAAKMQTSGWVGLFGIDCIYDEERDNIHLIEINARQSASVTYESQLQEKIRGQIAAGAGDRTIKDTNMTIFEAHIAALTRHRQTSAAKSIIEINDGAQIVDRITKIADTAHSPETTRAIAANLRNKGYTVIEYENTKPGADLLRVQSVRGIMEAHKKFNSRGKEILDGF